MYRCFSGNNTRKVIWCQIIKFLEYNVEEFGAFSEIIWSELRNDLNYFGDYSRDHGKHRLERGESGGRQTIEETVTEVCITIVHEVKRVNLRRK